MTKDSISPISARQIKYGSVVGKSVDPLRTNYVFDGWYWNRAPQPDVKWDFDTLVPGDMSLYANWNYEQIITDPTLIGGYFD